jgi:predicted permease
MRQLLIESLVLVTIGAALGVLLAENLSAVLIASVSTPNDPLFLNLAMDWRAVGFTTALAALACVLFGLAPALRATKARPEIVLREGVRGITSGRSRFGLRQVLVISQIALSLMLTVGAMLFARSLNNLAGLDVGFNQNGIMVADLDFSSAKLPPDRRREFSNELLDRVRALGEVKSAAIAAIVPLSGDGIGHDILLDSAPEAEADAPVAACNIVSPGYFETMQTRLLAGRDFDEHDTPTSPRVAIVNETFARKLAKVGNPLGMKFRMRVQNKITLYQVIGLAQDTKYIELRENLWPIVYTVQAQEDRFGTDAQIVIRSSTGLATLMSSIKDVTLKTNPNMEITFSVLHTTIENGLLRDRLMARLSGFFGILAVVLAAVGIYGVISYTVARRKSELAIRMAVGASRGSVIRLVLGETLILLVCGLALGAGLALAGGKAATAMLFGLKPWDAATFAAAVFTLALVAVGASVWPAMMAAWADPMAALREE